VIIASGFLSAASGWAHSTSPSSTASLYAVIDSLVASPPHDHETVERLLGIPLSRVSLGAFDSYEARALVLRDVTLETIDYREPPKDSSEFGPLLAITVGAGV
jgi:hypothetical protein